MDKELTPLGVLLENSRLRRRPRLSQNAVAKAAGTSPTTYRRVISGISRFGGQDVPFNASAETVARIADVLGITPDELYGVGSKEASEELRILHLQRSTNPGGEDDEDEDQFERMDRLYNELKRDPELGPALDTLLSQLAKRKAE